MTDDEHLATLSPISIQWLKTMAETIAKHEGGNPTIDDALWWLIKNYAILAHSAAGKITGQPRAETVH